MWLKKQFRRDGLFHPTKNYNKIKISGDKVINVGAGSHKIAGTISIDPYAPADIKAFGNNLPFESGSIDMAICDAVLEHVGNPQEIVAEMYRVLKIGGKIYIGVPFLQPYHAAPDDYQRWTVSGLRVLCKDFNEIEVGVAVGAGSSLAWLIVECVQIFTKNKIIKNLTKIIVSPLKYIDKFILNRSINVASGIYFYGQK
ncbi:MAG: class I SAM-dependent methyltransferase [Candidatus Buchananbacteria bacterium]|nr:class I SAM-dependent methyltransferase [Candidatus Buchananbacteria bacterium]